MATKNIVFNNSEIGPLIILTLQPPLTEYTKKLRTKNNSFTFLGVRLEENLTFSDSTDVLRNIRAGFVFIDYPTKTFLLPKPKNSRPFSLAAHPDLT